MDLDTLMKIQITADEKRGFPVKFSGDRERISHLMKELVGLFGEVGEFANLLKNKLKLNFSTQLMTDHHSHKAEISFVKS